MSSSPITVFSRQRCVQCTATYRALDKSGLPYRVVDVDDDAGALSDVRAMGYQQVPVVVAGTQHWSGFRPDLIKAAAERSRAA